MTTRIVVGGLRGAGKSVFTTSLYLCLQDRGVNVGLHEIDVYSDTHGPLLGQKSWEQRQGKHHVWVRTVERRVAEFAADPSDVVIGDLPGKLTNPNMPLMVKHADAAILIDRHPVLKDGTNKHHRTAQQWQQWLEARDVPVIAVVFSVLPQQGHPEGTFPVAELDRHLYGPNPHNPVFDLLLPHLEPHLALTGAIPGRLSA